MMRPASTDDDLSLARTAASTLAGGVVRTIAHWRVLLLGQAISLVLAVAGATNEILAVECGVSAPATYNLFGFAVVAIFGAMLVKIQERSTRTKTREAASGAGLETESLHDVEDELTEDGSATKHSIFSLRRPAREGRQTNGHFRTGGSDGSHGRRRAQEYPFLCGAFTLHVPWHYYLVVAFIEVQAYYLLFLAFRYTSFTFVYVADAMAIPSAMIFSKIFMKRRYRWPHIIGGVVCIAGIVLNTASDMTMDDLQQKTSFEHIKGDMFAITGAVLLGLDDVLSEIIVSDFGGVNEMLFMKGLFGALISAVQVVILERDSVQDLFGAAGSCALSWKMALFTIHILTRSLDVAGEMTFLYVSEAALLNLLLLTSDLFAVVFDVVKNGLRPPARFYGAFALVLLGIVLFEAAPSPAAEAPSRAPTQIELRMSVAEAERAGRAT